MQTREQATRSAAALRAVAPANWSIRVENCEARPGQAAYYKVVASDAGMAIVAHARTGRFFVTLNNGPGEVEAIANREFTGIGADRGWVDAATAFGKLKDLIVTRHALVSRQYASFRL